MGLEAELQEMVGAPVRVRFSARATRMSMAVVSATGAVRLSAPEGTTPRQIRDFVARHAGWAAVRLSRLPPRVPFTEGAAVPVFGVERRIRQDQGARFSARFADGPDGPEILVGRTEFLESRVRDAIKDEARQRFSRLAAEMSAVIGRKVASVAVKDTLSRWGSCAADGSIAFSWRLALAPPEISDYVVAHEVAHLAEMNHGVRFWRICKQLSPIPPERARRWLERNGAALHRYGPE